MTSTAFWDGFAPEKRDPRTLHWALMASVWPTIGICATYVILAVYVGPAFMASRKPMDLRGPMNFYNLFQVVGNVGLLYGYFANGWLTTYNWGKLSK